MTLVTPRKHPLVKSEADALQAYLKRMMTLPLIDVRVIEAQVMAKVMQYICTWHTDNGIVLPTSPIRIYSTGGASLWVDVGYLLEIN